MSQVTPKIDGWVGYGDGASILLESGTPVDADHPVVKERPELFDAPPAPEPRKAARPKPPNG